MIPQIADSLCRLQLQWIEELLPKCWHYDSTALIQTNCRWLCDENDREMIQKIDKFVLLESRIQTSNYTIHSRLNQNAIGSKAKWGWRWISKSNGIQRAHCTAIR